MFCKFSSEFRKSDALAATMPDSTSCRSFCSALKCNLRSWKKGSSWRFGTFQRTKIHPRSKGNVHQKYCWTARRSNQGAYFWKTWGWIRSIHRSASVDNGDLLPWAGYPVEGSRSFSLHFRCFRGILNTCLMLLDFLTKTKPCFV